jgi:hypothetical protein
MSTFTYDDAECARILAMTHDEIVAEVRAQGIDPQKVTDEVDRIIAAAKVDAYRRCMKLFV